MRRKLQDGYEAYLDDALSKDEYCELKERLDAEIDGLTREIEEASVTVAGIKDEISKLEDADDVSCLGDVFDRSVLTNEVADKFVESIIVRADGRITIKWKFEG